MIGNQLLCVVRLSESKLSKFYYRAALNAGRSIITTKLSVRPSICLSVCLSACLSVG